MNISKRTWKNLGLFAGGFALGTAGVKVLASEDAKRCYANVVAAVLRMKDSTMETVERVQAGAEDVYEEAKEINRFREEDFFDDDFDWDDEVDMMDDDELIDDEEDEA